jgi:hypothetical protein
MPLFQVQSVLHTTNNLPADFVTNTWWISVRNDVIGSPTQEELVDGINGHLVTFYDAIRQDLSPLLSVTGHEFKWYAMEDPTPRTPKYLHSWTFGSAFGGFAMPSEVALVSSYQATKQSGVAQATRRNRIFLGPMNTSAQDAVLGRPATATVVRITDAAEAFAATSDGANGWSWRVYSGKTGEDHPIADGWVDNAWDTQRRRGIDPSSRTVWVQKSE